MIRTAAFLVLALAILRPALAHDQLRDIEIHSKHWIHGIPLGAPVTNDLIIRDSYALSSNDQTKFADWVAYRLTPREVAGTVDLDRKWRADQFLDEAVLTFRAAEKAVDSDMTTDEYAYTSREFYHFVGRSTLREPERSYEILLNVLNGGCVSHRPHERGPGLTQICRNLSNHLLNEDLIVPTVTCYCDIPFNGLGIHMTKYGRFAVSFARDFVLHKGARPVIYVPYGIALTATI